MKTVWTWHMSMCRSPSPGRGLSRLLCLGILWVALPWAHGASDTNLWKLTESFENGVPTSWVSSDGGELSIDERFVKDGLKALRWDWVADSSITVNTRIAPYTEVKVPWFYPGLRMWVHQRKAHEGKLTLIFLEGEKTCDEIELDLGFEGWEQVVLPYRIFSQISKHEPTRVDAVRFQAPPGVPTGSLTIDVVEFDAGTGGRPRLTLAPRYDRPSSKTQTDVADLRHVPPAPVSEETRQAIRDVRERMMAAACDTLPFAYYPNPDPSNFDNVMEAYDSYGFKRDSYGIYSTTGKHLAEGPDSRLMLTMARMSHQFPEESEQRMRLTGAFCDMYEQIFAEGAVWKLGWYSGFPLALGTFLMRDSLEERGLLPQATAFMGYGYNFDERIAPRTLQDSDRLVSMDYFGLDVPVTLMLALCDPDARMQYGYLRQFSTNLSSDILSESALWGGFRPDGSAYHHMGHYYAYMRYCGEALADVVYALSGSEFAIYPPAYARLKTVYMNLRFYANGERSPNLGGRHPFNSEFDQPRENSRAFRLLALSNPALPSGGVDQDLAAAYLRWRGEPDGQNAFGDPSILPESLPVGNLSMPLASLSAHRRGTWLALARCPSRYLWTSELFANRTGSAENRRGRYQGAGTLDVFSGKDLEHSGYQNSGWDFSHFPGATALRLAEKDLVYTGREFPQVYTDRSCVGGLSFAGRNGCFAADFSEPSFPGGVQARKSYFFLDDCIVALGSDITAEDAGNPVDTTLFQLYAHTQTVINVNGDLVGDLPWERTLPPSSDAQTLIDSRQTGYYLFPQQSLYVRRELQPNMWPGKPVDEKQPFSIAWLNHGVAPTNGTYRYVVFPDTTEDTLQAFRDAMLTSSNAPLEIVRQDSNAHVVYDRRHQRWSGVLFEPQALLDAPPRTEGAGDTSLILRQNNLPCLFMIEPDVEADSIRMAVADPDLRVERIEGKGPTTVIYESSELTLTLDGRWVLVTDSRHIQLHPKGDNTELILQCRQGESIEFVVQRDVR